MCGSLLGEAATKQRKSDNASYTRWIYSGIKHENTLDSWSSALNFLCMPVNTTEKVTFSLHNVVRDKLDFIQLYG